MTLHDDGFRFGIEAEFLLVETATLHPLGYRELLFGPLNALLESVAVGDLPPIAGLLPQPPHRRVMPYVVEGYHLPDPEAADPELIPKGVEIRTPVCRTIDEAVAVLGELHARLQVALAQQGYTAVALAHHPLDDRFEGPQGARTESAWRWAMQAMLTFGPDVNVGLPPKLFAKVDAADLSAKVNHYAAAMTLPSLAAPFERGGLWRRDGRIGKSLRTFRRAAVGQALEWHPQQPGRLEFKCFDMMQRAEDFRAALALWLALLLDDGLAGRSDEAARQTDLQAVALAGWEDAALRDRTAELLDRSATTLAQWSFDPAMLSPFAARLHHRNVPADEMIAQFERTGGIKEVLRSRAAFMVESPA